MTQILDWLTQYSPAIVLMLVLAAGLMFVIKLVVERGIASGFDRKSKIFDALLKRRSTFEEKVLMDRFALVTGLHARLEHVMTNLNRMSHGKPTTAGFVHDGEIIPLTGIFEDLEIHRLVLGETFHGLLYDMARTSLAAAKASKSNPDERRECAEAWSRLRQEVRTTAETAFGINQIQW